jgi:hypothetical protein
MEIGLVEESAVFLDGFSRWSVILDGYFGVAGRGWPLLNCLGVDIVQGCVAEEEQGWLVVNGGK